MNPSLSAPFERASRREGPATLKRRPNHIHGIYRMSSPLNACWIAAFVSLRHPKEPGRSHLAAIAARWYSWLTGPRSSADRALASGARGAGSSPAGGTCPAADPTTSVSPARSLAKLPLATVISGCVGSARRRGRHRAGSRTGPSARRRCRGPTAATAPLSTRSGYRPPAA